MSFNRGRCYINVDIDADVTPGALNLRIHIYDDIDEWELYDLEKDPQELKNLINDSDYDIIEAKLHKKIDSLQVLYKVTNKEFERAPKESVDKAYKQFERLRGKTSKKNHHH